MNFPSIKSYSEKIDALRKLLKNKFITYETELIFTDRLVGKEYKIVVRDIKLIEIRTDDGTIRFTTFKDDVFDANIETIKVAI